MKDKTQKQNAPSSTLYAPRNRGVTLVELLIYMGIFGILLVVLSQVFVSTLGVRRESEAFSSVAQDARFIFSRIEHDIKHAQTIDIPANLGDQASSLQLTTDGVSETYALSGGNLMLNGVQLNSYDTTVSNVSFERLGNVGGRHSIRLTYTITGKVIKESGSEIKTVQTTFGLR